MGYSVLDGCLSQCWDVRELVEGWGYGQGVQGCAIGVNVKIRLYLNFDLYNTKNIFPAEAGG